MPASRSRPRAAPAPPARALPSPRVRPGSDGRFATRGQPAALAAVERMIRLGAPQALLLVGPRSTGKTTLALDLAAGLLCHAENPGDRPCGACRSCRLVDAGEHQDLHRLAPEGPGRQVRIGDPEDPEPGTVRHLVRELARLPVEGPRRVAIVEGADRLNDDAQNALLKTLEEPPARVTLVLCVDEVERLLPTVRSRAAVLRLGPVAVRAIEELLAEYGVEPPRAGRLARLADGRPGRAIALAAAPEAVTAREELARSILDLLGAPTAQRLLVVRELLARAADLARVEASAADAAAAPTVGGAAAPAAIASGAGAAIASDGAAPTGAAPTGVAPTAPGLPSPTGARAGDGEPSADQRAARGTPTERRLAAGALLEVWTAVARDLAVVAAGCREEVRDPALLDDLEEMAPRVRVPFATAFLGRLTRAGEMLEANANPELLLDALALTWTGEAGPEALGARTRAADPGVPVPRSAVEGTR